MTTRTNSDLVNIYDDLVNGVFTPQEPLVGLIFMDSYTESCTCFKNSNNNLACYLPYSRLAWLCNYDEFEFLTSSKHIVWQA